MKILLEMKTNQEESLKYAYAFMKSNLLKIKECSFPNPHPTHFKKGHLFPADAYAAAYDEKNLPTWEIFKTNPLHLIDAFSCIGSVDPQDTKRVNCTSMFGLTKFVCYGNYEKEAKLAVDEILTIYETLS